MKSQDFHISNDKSKLDLKLIHQYLSKESYWAKGRTFEIVTKSIKHSLCFGVYQDQQQVGFARVVTDFSVFAWVMDVFVVKEYQGKGLGKLLMSAVLEHPELQTISRWGLNTWDAHGLYRQYGFETPKDIEIYMEKT